MAKLVQGEKENFGWFRERSYFAIRTPKIDCSRTDFVKLCFREKIF